MQLLSYPSEELELYTRITFSEYSRPKPNSQAEIKSTSSIRLPLPESIPDNYGVTLNSFDMGSFGSTASDWAARGQSIADSAGSIDSLKGRLGGAMSNFVALAPGISDTRIGRFAQSELGRIRNPHTTTIFDGVSLRTHTFSFRLSPRNQQEAESIMNIIKEIRMNMLPREDFGRYALDYPSLVEVEFNGIDGTITPVFFSFIQSFTPNYTGGGGPAFYKDGKPIETTITLSLQEINIVTRETFGAESGDSTLQNNNTGSVPGAAPGE